MTVVEHEPPAAGGHTDPFAAPPPAAGPGRPRLLSHVGRWGRARRWLPDDALRVLDVGCSFAYGSAAIQAGGPPGRMVVGVERDSDHLAGARDAFPWMTVLEGDATALPVPDGVADAVTMLDIVEHVDSPDAAIAEARRVIRPEGVLILSVPHRGLLHRLDALNVYSSLRRRKPHWPALEAATESGGHEHGHFTVGELKELLEPAFRVDRVARRGVGLQEVVAFVRLLLIALDRAPWLVRRLQLIHLAVYVLDELLPLGPLGYHLTARAVSPPRPEVVA